LMMASIASLVFGVCCLLLIGQLLPIAIIIST
jgi:hypothetical protein